MNQLDKPKQRFHAPTIMALAVTVFILIAIFSLGFWAGVQSMQIEPTTKQAGPTFERTAAHFKMQQPILERMPEELP